MLLSRLVLTCGVLTVPALFYTLASFFQLQYPHSSMSWAMAVSVAWATCEYVVRVPAMRYAHNQGGFSFVEIQGIWIVLTLLLAWAAQLVMTPQKTK